MTFREARKLKRIFKCIQDAYSEIDKATDNREEDVKFVFGTSAKPTWAKEDHIHLMSGVIVNLSLTADGDIMFAPENWRNVFGEQIIGVIGPHNEKGKNSISFYLPKFEWRVTIGFANSYYANNATSKQLHINEILHWVIDNFNIKIVEEHTAQLRCVRTKREFGLALKESYYLTKKEKSQYDYEASYALIDEKKKD